MVLNKIKQNAPSLSRFFSIVFGVCVFLSLFISFVTETILSGVLLLIGWVSLGLMYIVNSFIPKIKPKSSSLVEKVKSELRINHVRHIKKKFYKPFSWIGGLVLPAFPTFTLVNTDWKKKLSDEAVIHENAHIYLMLHKYWVIYLFVGPAIFSVAWFIIFDYMSLLTPYLCMIIMLTAFEKHTFYLTNDIADRLNVPTRKWSWNIAIRYLIIYAIQISIVVGIFYGLQTFIRWLLW